MVIESIWFLGVGVLFCRGNHLLTGSNTRWLRLWEVEAVKGVKPQEKVCNVEDRFVESYYSFCVLYRQQPLFSPCLMYHINIVLWNTVGHHCHFISGSLKFCKQQEFTIDMMGHFAS